MNRYQKDNNNSCPYYREYFRHQIKAAFRVSRIYIVRKGIRQYVGIKQYSQQDYQRNSTKTSQPKAESNFSKY